MPIRSNIPRCTHIKLGGRRCGSPALSGEHYCYFHMQVKGASAARVDSAIPSIMLLEDADSIQGAIMQVINLMLQDQIPLAKARLVLRAIEMASRNLKGMKAGEPAEEQASEEQDCKGCRCEKQESEDLPKTSSADLEKPLEIYAMAEEEIQVDSRNIGLCHFRPRGGTCC